MNYVVSPKSGKAATHHILLEDRDGKRIGLIACDDNGLPTVGPGTFTRQPVDTTAQKQTSGSSSYSDWEYPYSPVVQDDLSGGRASQDFERDSTKFFDSYRAKTGRANKAYPGPQEVFASGIASLNQDTPGSVRWVQLLGERRYIYKRFQASATFTVSKLWIRIRRKGKPSSLTIALYSDTAGAVGSLLTSITVSYTRMDDILAEWLNEDVSQAITSGVNYWLVISASSDDNDDKHWIVATKNTAGTSYASTNFSSTPTAATFDVYYRLTQGLADKTCITFEYNEQTYFVISTTTGAPKLYMAGYRGAADANTGALNKLKDATMNWSADELVGQVVMVIDGKGKDEPQPWRVITGNTSNDATVSPSFTIEHDTTTVYVILSDKINEITGHGLTGPVTDVQVSPRGFVMLAQGDGINIRWMREYNNSGTWTREFRDDSNGSTINNKAVFLDYKPQAQKVVKANNSDANGDVSVALSDLVDWATGYHTFSATPTKVDSKYRRITGTIVYPDTQGLEAVWVFKTDLPFIVPTTGNPFPVNLPEMTTVRSPSNGKALLVHNVYLYFSMQQGLQRYYNMQIDDIGPNLGEGLPTNRRGPIVSMQGYPGKFFVAIDAGSSGYSSILDSDGWHERYRAPKGQRIGSLYFQVIPGSSLDRLWVFQGNELIYLPFPSETVNELEDAAYPYTDEFAVILSRMHAGMFDVQKMVRLIKLQTEGLETNTTGEPVTWFELDYRLDDDEEWTTFDDAFTVSPTQAIDLIDQYGIAGKRLQFRIRGYTTDRLKAPVLIAIIVSTVIRTDVKYMYSFQCRLMDNEPLLTGHEEEAGYAMDKLTGLENWSDASSSSMIKVASISPLLHGRVVFLNPPMTRQVRYAGEDNNDFKKDVFIVTLSLQEA